MPWPEESPAAPRRDWPVDRAADAPVIWRLGDRRRREPADLSGAVIELRLALPGGVSVLRSDTPGSGVAVLDQAQPARLGMVSIALPAEIRAALPAEPPAEYELRIIHLGFTRTLRRGAVQPNTGVA